MIAERALKTLEFYKIRNEVARYCTSSLGKNHIDKLVPSVEIKEVEQLLAEMDEAAQVLRVKNNVPMGGISMSACMRAVHKSEGL